MTTKRKILFYIPLIITACILAYTWVLFIFINYISSITNYIGLILFIPVIYFLFKDKSCKKPLLALGVYLLLATFNLANITIFVKSSWGISIFGLDIPLPSLNGFSLLLFTLYCVLNFGTLVELQLDYKESKGKL
jgi:hypothetical protein